MKNIQTITDQIFENYDSFKEKSITHRRFKHSDMLKILDKIKSNEKFNFEFVGKSVLGRELNLISTGKGKTKIFLWSQMHGNESTATMALFDIFNFFLDTSSLNDIKETILNNLTLYFLPMVNPDGTELFQRENIYNIDINRDALALQTPEGRILMESFKKIEPVFSFNLHDQSILYSAGNTHNPSTISFLAPAYDKEKSLNPTREKSMRIIGALYKVLSKYIPACIARYSDEFEPRAYGDIFQSMGSSTILIESGGSKNDTEKQFIRKLNFFAILTALFIIADKYYEDIKLSLYEEIPYNEEKLFNTVLRNLTFKENEQNFSADIGIIMEEINKTNGSGFYQKSEIGGIGDLSTFYGYEEYNLKGYEIVPGKTYSKKFKNINELSNTIVVNLLNQGYTNVVVEETEGRDFSPLPINILSTRNEYKKNKIKTENPADFVISKNGKINFTVINGFFINLSKEIDTNINGRVYH
ncbi:MAG: peptidase M14 [Bacteroidetes bacterium]|nr:peptidase M14 [Bacteroidota bacterium]